MSDQQEQERRMNWLLEEHDRMKELIAELQQREPTTDVVKDTELQPDSECPYMFLASIVVLLSYLYGITLGVYMCPK